MCQPLPIITVIAAALVQCVIRTTSGWMCMAEFPVPVVIPARAGTQMNPSALRPGPRFRGK